jgi:hypothetical protein
VIRLLFLGGGRTGSSVHVHWRRSDWRLVSCSLAEVGMVIRFLFLGGSRTGRLGYCSLAEVGLVFRFLFLGGGRTGDKVLVPWRRSAW